MAKNQKSLKISGQILTQEGRAAKALTVTAWRKCIGEDDRLGKDTTDEIGRYEIKSRYKGKADIYIKISDPGNSESMSSVRYNVNSDQVFNLVTSTRPAQNKSEFRKLSDALQPHLNGNKLEGIKENDQNQDISLLSGRTGWDARLIAMAALAGRLSSSGKIPPAMFYAIFRAGIPAGEASVFALHRQTVKKIWNDAVKKNIVDKAGDKKISEYLSAFEKKRTAFLLKHSGTGWVSPLKELLSFSLPDQKDQENIIGLYYAHTESESQFWEKVETKFPEKVSGLKLGNRMGYLTMNNLPLMERLREKKFVEKDMADLIKKGLHKQATWEDLIDDGIDIPGFIAGKTKAEKKKNYSLYMSSMLKISYPGAVVCQMILDEELSLQYKGKGKNKVKEEVCDFLSEDFDLGRHAIVPFVREKKYKLSLNALKEIKRLQRVYQLSPSDLAMKVLLDCGLDSAFSIVTGYDRKTFIDQFSDKVGSQATAMQIYSQAEQIHGTVLNLAAAYQTMALPPIPYVMTGTGGPKKPPNDHTRSIAKTDSTLEALFGSLDYCACGHCRSVLSPAAYLVDLLHFLDRDDEVSKKNILDEVLLKRRPDLEFIELTCENTDTVLPYIDLVNEVLEYLTVHQDINGFKGFNTGNEIGSSELLAAPQHVDEAAYDSLKSDIYPLCMPYNDSLEVVRLSFEDREESLCRAMETFYAYDHLDPTTPLANAPYGPSDICMERIGISPTEFNIFTGKTAHTLPEFFGIDKNTPIDTFKTMMSKARVLARTLGISYKELTAIIKTKFINPGATLLPALENLEMTFSQIEAVTEDTPAADSEFNSALPPGLNEEDYGGSAAEWVKTNFETIRRILLLTKTEEGLEECNPDFFDVITFSADLPEEIDFWKIYRFIRLWKKLGYTIQETDRLITGLYDDTLNVEDGEQPLPLTLLNLRFKDLLMKISCFEKATHFLHLTSPEDKFRLLDLQKGFGPSDDAESTGRYLSRAMDLTLEDLTVLQTLSGCDPFVPIDPANPSIIKFIETADWVKKSGFEPSFLDYLFRHVDASGRNTPNENELISLAGTLKRGLVRIEKDHQVLENPDEKITRSKMVLIYGEKTVDEFFSLLAGAAVYSISYTHGTDELGPNIIGISEHISYDKLNMLLSYSELMPDDVKTNLSAFLPVDTVTALYDLTHDLFNRYPDLETLYNNALAVPIEDRYSFILNTILPGLKYMLKKLFIRKTMSTLANVDADAAQTILENKDVMKGAGPETSVDQGIEDLLALERDGTSCAWYFSDDIPVNTEPDDTGYNPLGVAFDMSNEELLKPPDNANVPGAPISASFECYLEAPEDGEYAFFIESDSTEQDPSASVKLFIDREQIQLAGPIQGGIRHTPDAVSMKSGVLYHVRLDVLKFSKKVVLKWKCIGLAKTLIPGTRMIPSGKYRNFKSSCIRFLKTMKVMTGLGFNATEINFALTRPDFLINGLSFAQAIPPDHKTGIGQGALSNELTDVFIKLLTYRELKQSYDIRDETLCCVINSPEDLDEDKDLKLLKVTGWGPKFKPDLTDLLNHFEFTISDLSDIKNFIRTDRAVRRIKTLGVPAADLLKWVTNRPVDANSAQNLRTALIAGYDTAQRLKRTQSVHDKLRGRRRDALVSHVLYRLSLDEDTKHIDSADKLFEYLLLDVQREPINKTSRIKQATLSVQTFVQNCLMNREPQVSAETINRDRWAVMCRYRVWEANRKVFLWPENWLDPEFRDDKSFLFKDLEGELLQSDITEASAFNAYMNYLEKLDELAKLEVVGFCREHADTGVKKDAVIHVVGRTRGASRKQYYRRFEGGTWGPWEKIGLDIEDIPVLILVWENRLFLFWLNIVQKNAEGEVIPSTASGKAADLKVEDLNREPRANFEVSLSWSEYSAGRWKPKKTTDMDNPILFTNKRVSSFRRKYFELEYAFNEGLHIDIKEPWTDSGNGFKFHTPNSDPELYTWVYDTQKPYLRYRFLGHYNVKEEVNPFAVSYSSAPCLCDPSGVSTQKVLQDADPYQTLTVHEYPERLSGELPFFYMDYRRLFFVTTQMHIKSIPEKDDLNTVKPVYPNDAPRIPELFRAPEPWGVFHTSLLEKVPWDIFTEPGYHGPNPIDPVAAHSVRIKPGRLDAVPAKVMPNKEVFIYNGVEIGPMGSGFANSRFTNEVKDSDFEQTRFTSSHPH